MVIAVQNKLQERIMEAPILYSIFRSTILRNFKYSCLNGNRKRDVVAADEHQHRTPSNFIQQVERRRIQYCSGIPETVSKRLCEGRRSQFLG